MVNYVINYFRAVVLSSTHNKRLPLMHSPVQHSHTTPVLLLHKVAFHAPHRVDVHDPLDY